MVKSSLFVVALRPSRTPDMPSNTVPVQTVIINNTVPNIIWNTVPDAQRLGRTVFQSLNPTDQILVVPTVEYGAGNYLGSNVSYNLKKLVDMGYIHHHREKNRRSVKVSLTDSGREIAQRISNLFKRNYNSLENVGGVSSAQFVQTSETLSKLERHWTDSILYRR